MRKTYTFDDVSIVPQFSKISSRSDCKTSTRLSRNFDMRTPIIATPMDTITELQMAWEMDRLGGLGIIHRFMPIVDQIKMVKDFKLANWDRVGIATTHIGGEREFQFTDSEFIPKIGGAIGIKSTERALALLKAGVNILMIDVAHADHELVYNMIKELHKFKSTYIFDLIVGTIATKSSAQRMINAGVDGVVVGVGGGSLCETRIRAGVGIPMITSISDVADAIEQYDPNVSLIATGGMKTPGDVAKAIAAGADSAMLGSMISGTKETPGIIQRNGTYGREMLYKSYRGSASSDSKSDRGETKNVEGNSTTVPYRGKVKRIINEIIEGLQSSMSYVGADNILDFKVKAELCEISQSGILEAKPHLLY